MYCVTTQQSANIKPEYRETLNIVILTKHGFKLDQATDEVVKVNHFILCVPSYQYLVQFVV